MNQELDYAEMLEIPVSTVNVVKKKSFFKRRQKAAPQPVDEELKELVVDSVNERVGAYTYAEDVSDPPKPEKHKKSGAKGAGSKIVIGELVAVCVLAVAIFLTNFFMPTSAINTFIGSLASIGDKPTEAAYTDFTLSPIVSALSDAEVTVSESGVLSFTGESSVYPVCSGTVYSVTENDGLYTVQINHTSTFKSVITGLSDVYVTAGAAVKGNLPFAYSDGETQVNVSMYDGETLLNCYSLSGVVPVWNS